MGDSIFLVLQRRAAARKAEQAAREAELAAAREAELAAMREAEMIAAREAELAAARAAEAEAARRIAAFEKADTRLPDDVPVLVVTAPVPVPVAVAVTTSDPEPMIVPSAAGAVLRPEEPSQAAASAGRRTLPPEEPPTRPVSPPLPVNSTPVRPAIARDPVSIVPGKLINLPSNVADTPEEALRRMMQAFNILIPDDKTENPSARINRIRILPLRVAERSAGIGGQIDRNVTGGRLDVLARICMWDDELTEIDRTSEQIQRQILEMDRGKLRWHGFLRLTLEGMQPATVAAQLPDRPNAEWHETLDYRILYEFHHR